MKITGLETVRVAERANLLWLLVHTDEGITGLGETFLEPRRSKPMCTNTSRHG